MTARAARRTPAGRYGRPAGRRRRLATYGGLGLLAAILLAGLLTIAVHQSDPAVQTRLISYAVRPGGVEVRFEVVKAPADAVLCTVRARDRAGAQVGLARLRVPARADGRRVTTVRYDLPTRGRANIAEVTICTRAGRPR